MKYFLYNEHMKQLTKLDASTDVEARDVFMVFNLYLSNRGISLWRYDGKAWATPGGNGNFFPHESNPIEMLGLALEGTDVGRALSEGVLNAELKRALMRIEQLEEAIESVRSQFQDRLEGSVRIASRHIEVAVKDALDDFASANFLDDLPDDTYE